MLIASDAPPRARTAIILLWVSILLTLIQTILSDLLSGSSAISAVVVVLAIYGLIIFRASRRHNWARYALLVWTVLGAAVYLTNFQSDAQPWWDSLLAIVSFAIEIVAIYMLFTDAASQWYRPKVAS